MDVDAISGERSGAVKLEVGFSVSIIDGGMRGVADTDTAPTSCGVLKIREF